MSEDQDQAADPVESIRRYCRSIRNALAVIDQVNPAAASITSRMRGTIETLTYDLSELNYFLPKRPEKN